MDGLGEAPEGGGPGDPFGEFVLDEAFVAAAVVAEPSAEERALAEERRRRREALARYEAVRYADELAERQQEAWRARRRRVLRTVASLVVAGLVGTLLWAALRDVGERAASPIPGGLAPGHDIAQFGATDLTERPPPSPEAQGAPIGTPAEVPGAGGYRFAATQADGERPVAYDPCRPIHYVTYAGNPTDRAEELLADAIEEISSVTGLQFVDDGPTTEPPSDGRSAYQPSRYPDRWAPVLIAWSDAEETPRLAGRVAGLGGSAWVDLDDGVTETDRVYVSGVVTLDGTDLRRMQRSGGDAVVREVILHELGHLVGLDHVEDRGQVMYAEASETLDGYQAGDRRGLARLGAGACNAEL